MTLKEIRVKAKSLGVVSRNLKKADLIHEIQKAESNVPCYGMSDNNHCDRADCLWLHDCLKVK